MQVSGGCGVVHVVEHVPSHLPVLVGGGVGQHRPHQHDADGQEPHRYAEQGPLCLAGRLLDSFDWDWILVYLGLGVGVEGDRGQLYRITKVGWNINKRAGIVLKIHSFNF